MTFHVHWSKPLPPLRLVQLMLRLPANAIAHDHNLRRPLARSTQWQLHTDPILSQHQNWSVGWLTPPPQGRDQNCFKYMLHLQEPHGSYGKSKRKNKVCGNQVNYSSVVKGWPTWSIIAPSLNLWKQNVIVSSVSSCLAFSLKWHAPPSKTILFTQMLTVHMSCKSHAATFPNVRPGHDSSNVTHARRT